jgi:hypothetical protein
LGTQTQKQIPRGNDRKKGKGGGVRAVVFWASL